MVLLNNQCTVHRLGLCGQDSGGADLYSPMALGPQGHQFLLSHAEMKIPSSSWNWSMEKEAHLLSRSCLRLTVLSFTRFDVATGSFSEVGNDWLKTLVLCASVTAVCLLLSPMCAQLSWEGRLAAILQVTAEPGRGPCRLKWLIAMVTAVPLGK